MGFDNSVSGRRRCSGDPRQRRWHPTTPEMKGEGEVWAIRRREGGTEGAHRRGRLAVALYAILVRWWLSDLGGWVRELGVSSSTKKRGVGKTGQRRSPSSLKGIMVGRICEGGGTQRGWGGAWRSLGDSSQLATARSWRAWVTPLRWAWDRGGGVAAGWAPGYSLRRRRFDLIQIRIQTKSNSIQIIPNFVRPKKDLPKIEQFEIK
jgi:hypothetical protein